MSHATQPSPSPSPAPAARRRFLGWVIGALTCLEALVVGVPFLANLVGPALRRKSRHFARVTSLSSLPAAKPLDVSYADVEQDAYIEQRAVRNVWVIKHSEQRVTVFSPICPHLGCRFDWQPNIERFVCPCHGSVFAMDGEVLKGPAPRPLDSLPERIERDELLVEWERFEAGTSKKIVV